MREIADGVSLHRVIKKKSRCPRSLPFARVTRVFVLSRDTRYDEMEKPSRESAGESGNWK